jgi:hypothetical protein
MKFLLKMTGKIIFFVFTLTMNGVFTKFLSKMTGTINFSHNGTFMKFLLKMTGKIIFFVFTLTMNDFFMKNFIENDRDNE